MNRISDAALVAALRRQMTIAAAKQVAAAGNLANIDTPGYKAVEVDVRRQRSTQKLSPTRLDQPQAPSRRSGPSGGTASEVQGCDGPPRRQQRAARSRTADDDTRGRRLQPPRRPRWPRSSGWFATPSTRAAKHVHPECRHQRQRQRADRRAHAHRSRRLEHRQRRVDARSADGEPYRRRDVVLAAEPVDSFDCRARPGPAHRREGRRRSSKTRRRSASATNRRIPTPTRRASSRCPTSTRRRRWSTCSAPRAPIRPTSTAIGTHSRPGRQGARAREVTHACPLICHRRQPRRRRHGPAAQPARCDRRRRRRPAVSATRSASSSTASKQPPADANTAVGRHARQDGRRARRDDRAAARRDVAAARPCRSATSWCRPTRTSCGCRSRRRVLFRLHT